MPPHKLTSQYRLEDKSIVVSVPSEDAAQLVRLNGYSFAGTPIAIEPVNAPELPEVASLPGQTTASTIQMLKAVLSRRYNAAIKLLDLSALGSDPDLQSIGVFGTASTQSKFFPALMKVCDEQFRSADEKRETVHSVSLARNELLSVTPVTTLAQAFPDLLNIDLSHNALANKAAIQPWKHKFRRLEHLVLSENPALEQSTPNLASVVARWYPTLRHFNGLRIRTDEEAQQQLAGPARINPLPVRAASFADEGQIAESFVKTFFLGFDNDRVALVNHYYDADSLFSLSVNTQALRATDAQPTTASGDWDAYIRRSRNLRKLTQLPARLSRSYCGADAIRDVITTLPSTRHPPLDGDDAVRWLVECMPQPGVPDPTGASPSGVGGFLISVHGEFDELEPGTGIVRHRRSFDRVFVLGPGGPSGVRVVSELWTLRCYGGHAAFIPTADASSLPPLVLPAAAIGLPPVLPSPESLLPVIPNTAATPPALDMDSLVHEFSLVTGMKAEFARQCLAENDWVPNKAVAAFGAAKASLPREVFV